MALCLRTFWTHLIQVMWYLQWEWRSLNIQWDLSYLWTLLYSNTFWFSLITYCYPSKPLFYLPTFRMVSDWFSHCKSILCSHLTQLGGQLNAKLLPGTESACVAGPIWQWHQQSCSAARAVWRGGALLYSGEARKTPAYTQPGEGTS